MPAIRSIRTAGLLMNLLPAAQHRSRPQANGYNYVQNVPLSQNNAPVASAASTSASATTRSCSSGTTSRPRGSRSPSASGGATPTRCRIRLTSSPTTDRTRRTTEPDEGLRLDADQRDDVRSHLHQLPEPARRSRARSRGRRSATRIPASTRTAWIKFPRPSTWGDGPTMFNPGGFDPVLFAKKWLVSGARTSPRSPARTPSKLGVLRVGEQQSAGEQQLQRTAEFWRTGRPEQPATLLRISDRAAAEHLQRVHQKSSATWATTSSRAMCRTAGSSSRG